MMDKAHEQVALRVNQVNQRHLIARAVCKAMLAAAPQNTPARLSTEAHHAVLSDDHTQSTQDGPEGTLDRGSELPKNGDVFRCKRTGEKYYFIGVDPLRGTWTMASETSVGNWSPDDLEPHAHTLK